MADTGEDASAKPTLEMKLGRMAACSESVIHPLSRNLLHAYAGCLTVEEACEAAVRTLEAPIDIRRAVLRRLEKVGEAGGSDQQLDRLGIRLMALASSGPRSRVRIDALLSQLYLLFSPPIRRAVLEDWRDRGKRGASGRWLKAISSDALLFAIDEVLSYWRATQDGDAVKLLADRGDGAFLAKLLPELIDGCDQGWMVSRAALRAESISKYCWEAIRGKFPASYAYLCAKLGRRITDAEALLLIHDAEAGTEVDDRGLVIWALGQLGMWSALEKIRLMLPSLVHEALTPSTL